MPLGARQQVLLVSTRREPIIPLYVTHLRTIRSSTDTNFY